MSDALVKLGDNPSAADVQRLMTPVAAAFEASDEALLRMAWPGPVAGDVDALVAANAALIADLRSAGSENLSGGGSWEARLSVDDVKAASAGRKVRRDLGLPSVG
jgi:hypothetical protein